jgi:hypothetical protein
MHRPITATPSVRGELAIGWAFHYGVGIIYAGIYLVLMRLAYGSGPTLALALAFAIILLVAPWFVMQPALGLGFMAARAPHPSVVRIVNISVHAVFGIGLYLGAIASRVSCSTRSNHPPRLPKIAYATPHSTRTE